MELPSLLLQSLENVKGFDKEAFEMVHTAPRSITSIRLNPAKSLTIQNVLAGGSGPTLMNSFHAVPWSTCGYYLEERPSFIRDPFWHGGAYYVQEASSMFLEQALRQTVNLFQPIKVLDLCAAPGGKSTLIQSLLSKESLLVSNEVIKTRVHILEENLIKWGGANTVITNNDPRDYQKVPGFFDVIVVDAPCSGSGLFRRDESAITEWSPQNVVLCSQRQQRILADVLPALKEGGVLIYSTCSYSVDENENNIDWLMQDMDMLSKPLTIDAKWNIVETISLNGGFGYRFYPDKLKGEGFYLAVLEKKASSEGYNAGKNKFEKPAKSDEAVVKEWLSNPDEVQFIKFRNEILALPESWDSAHFSLLSLLHIKKAGIKMGEVINGALLPDQQLALSSIVNNDVARAEVSEEDAIRYLRKENLQKVLTERGWVLINYQELPLGWAKVLPNRINNYYPKEWRIRK